MEEKERNIFKKLANIIGPILVQQVNYYSELSPEQLTEEFMKLDLKSLRNVIEIVTDFDEPGIREIAIDAFNKRAEWEEIPYKLEEMDEEDFTKALLENLSSLKDAMENDMLLCLKYLQEHDREELIIRLNKMTSEGIDLAYNMALQHEEYELCDTILPILNKKKQSTE